MNTPGPASPDQASPSGGAEGGCADQPITAKPDLSKPGRIAFVVDGDIYSMEADGGNEANLTKKMFGDRYTEIDPAWSPDGKKIAFSSNRGDDFNIFIMDSDGGGARQLTKVPGDEFGPRWSPDGKKLGFTSEVGDQTAIAVVNVDGTGSTTLPLDLSAPYIGLSDWSPDGSSILIDVDRTSSGGEIDTYVMQADGSCVRQLTDAAGDDSGGRWSPDGQEILFGSNRDGGGIYRMKADGTGQTPVVATPTDASGLDTFRPAWSPDGKMIAWTGKYEGNTGAEIYLMKSDGNDLRVVHDRLVTATAIDWQSLAR